MVDKTILVIGTYDTKNDELEFMASKIRALGGSVTTLDVSVLGDPAKPTDYSKHDVAEAGGSSIQAAIDSGSEHVAMQIMSAGACALARQLHNEGRIDGVIILGGTMGTDLALDVCQALPIGVPKYVVSTVSFSALIPAERLSPDIQMILWAGGLYGLNAICKSSLAQAAGAVLGAARAAEPAVSGRPVVGMTSLGTSCLKYVKTLKPALEMRGYEVAVFHAMGMGGMAFEQISSQNGFVCVMDFAGCELGNLMAGSVVNAGKDRHRAAGRAGIPQIVAPGCMDLIDFAGWQDIPEQFKDRPIHTHNKLVKNTYYNADERREIAREMNKRLGESKAPTHLIIPREGIEEWDRPGGDCHDAEGLAAFIGELSATVTSSVQVTELDAHINDPEFSAAALEIFDQWVADGTVPAGTN
ncbi:Tm-1-like ATP-binding domain-containing protein [Ruegeria sp. Ofav3-42]|uniref:Tm-1-like ATP-binding domain-containing protein n=1 Tax=Ruegeria sp. Ofav3-42 TaxID=2917759 RepID=UPI001EF3E837|nr:Tm-1-like ATP-binding domain-containing protein [Ruegeria sp. Ofav3-42]MCG7521496.1 Tm-1-like ATP-binding domain-containing protein [Ruegeria sp. Ofav3-42]